MKKVWRRRVSAIAGGGALAWAFWGFIPSKEFSVLAKYSAWETQAFLKQSYQDCSGDGCDTKWKVLEQRFASGTCGKEFCDVAYFPEIPDTWNEQATESDIEITFDSRFTIFLEDTEFRPGVYIPQDYSADKYAALVPQIGGFVTVSRNNFGQYSRL